MNSRRRPKKKAVSFTLTVAFLSAVLSSAATASNDQRFGEQWGLHKIGAEAAWGAARGDGVLIGMIDSGVDLSHPDLRGKIAGGKDFVDGDDSPDDQNGHGTLTAGVAAAETGNGVGIAGVAPGARILAARAFDGAGNGGSDKVAAGIYWAVDEARRRGSKLVLNLSFVGPGGSLLVVDDVRAAIDAASRSGAAVVAAAGNDGTESQYNAPSGSGILVVGASTREDACSRFSNYGEGVDILAPGGAGGRSPATDILSTYVGGGYASSSGTSLATPFVSGSMALLMSRGMSAGGAANKLIASARGPKVSCRGEASTYGFLDAAAALGAAAAPPPAASTKLSSAAPAQAPASNAPAPRPGAGPAAPPPAPPPPPPPEPATILLAKPEPKPLAAAPAAQVLQLPARGPVEGPVSPAQVTAGSLLGILALAHAALRFIFRTP